MKKILWRKAYRSGAILFPLIYYFHDKKETLIFTIIFVGVGLFIEFSRFLVPALNRVVCKIFAPVGREYEARKFSGMSWFLLAVVLTIVLFEKEIAIVSLLFLIFGDSAATLVGERFGKTKVWGKSLEGSMAFFLTCLVIGIILLFSELLIEMKLILWGALAATLAELAPLPLNDNFTIALACGAVMTLLK